MQPRPYQASGMQQIKDFFAQGIKRVLLHLATGGGKTLIFCLILKGAHQKKKKALVVVRGTQLIAQASERLTREGVEHGIMQGANSRGSWLPIQICSIDTLYRRRHAPPADLIIIDEAHQTSGDGYKWFLEQYQGVYLLAVSATPHLKKGMRHVADEVVYPISIRDLIDQGYLCPPRYFAPETPDLSDVRIIGGEYDERGLELAMKKAALTGKIVETWKKIGENRITICFCVTVAHSQMICQQFKDAGIAAEHVDASTPDDERKRLYAMLERGEIRVLCNVGILTTGFDCPPVSCLIIARPTMSYNLHIQIIGRGTRIFPGKENFIVLDHAGNVLKHAGIENEQQCELDPQPKKKKAAAAPDLKNCEACLAIYSPRAKLCPECGAENPEYEKPHRATEEIDGELKEFIARTYTWESEVDRLHAIAKAHGLKKGWIYNMLKDSLGEQTADEAWNKKVMRLRKWPTRDDPEFRKKRIPTQNYSAQSF